MKFGIFAIYLALAATLFSTWYYMKVSNIGRSRNLINNKQLHQVSFDRKLARQGFYIAVILIFIASFYLLYLIFAHKFQVSYVYRYSSLDLSFGYLLSAFWAGQEGSFLFWSLALAIMGIFIIKTSGNLESNAMIFFNIIQGFFLIILIKASPFDLLPKNPIDGAGLNPLLQNPWMIIHPPILFIGYAAITIPFVLSVAALIRGEYDDLVDKIFPWVKIDSSKVNRENALVAGIYVLVASAFFILIGTSSPILTGLLGNPAQVNLSFYNKVNFPIAIAISLLLGITPFLLWVEKDMKLVINL